MLRQVNRMQYRQRPLPSHSDLLAEMHRQWAYDSANGGFTWATSCQYKPRSGSRVGGSDGRGYLMTRLLGHRFKVHRLVWLWHHGELPQGSIDHINRIRSDNRIENIRLATDLQNQGNMESMTRSFAGVSRDPKGRGFVARIQRHGKKTYLGYFATKDAARAAYVEASRRLRGEYSAV